MDITVYLPDDLGKWAKEHDLHLSRMLREAVEIEKRRRDSDAALAAETTTHELAVSESGSSSGADDYTVRLHGVLIATQHLGSGGSIDVYAGEDDKMYVHYTADGQLRRDVEPEDLQQYVDEPTYIEAMRALGEDVVIDIGLPQ
jgi:post-segregation antitoxin (ccd killing protein)